MPGSAWRVVRVVAYNVPRDIVTTLPSLFLSISLTFVLSPLRDQLSPWPPTTAPSPPSP